MNKLEGLAFDLALSIHNTYFPNAGCGAQCAFMDVTRGVILDYLQKMEQAAMPELHRFVYGDPEAKASFPGLSTIAQEAK